MTWKPGAVPCMILSECGRWSITLFTTEAGVVRASLGDWHNLNRRGAPTIHLCLSAPAAKTLAMEIVRAEHAKKGGG